MAPHPTAPMDSPPRHIRLTSHPGQGASGAPPITWGAPSAAERGPVVGSTTHRSQRNVVGSHLSLIHISQGIVR